MIDFGDLFGDVIEYLVIIDFLKGFLFVYFVFDLVDK